MANLFNTIYTGTLAQYTSVTSKDANALYMVVDSETGAKSMYHGAIKVAGDFIIVNGGAPENPEQGTIYYISAFVKEEGKEGKPYVGFHDGTKWVALSDSATIEALDARIKALEDWKEETPFVEWSVRGDRKHIVLDNHDNILGVGTDGNEYNLAMVSKWDVADFGSTSLPMNLNSKDGRVTINDDKVVATLDDVQSTVEGLNVTDTEVEGSVVVAVSQEDGKVSNVKKAVAVAVTDTTEGMQKTYDVTIGEKSVGKIDIPFCDAVLANAVLADMNATVNEETGAVTAGDPKGADALVMVFKKGDGTYVGVKVNISKILVESEFKSGLAVSENGEVSVKLVANNDYLKFGTAAEGENAPLVANVVTLADAKAAEGDTPAVTGLADALDVKTVIEENEKVTAAALNNLNQRVGKNEELTTTSKVVVPAINELKAAIEGKNVDAEGDDYVSASAVDNKVTVAATDSTKASLAKADTAVQTIAVATEGQEVTVSTKSAENGYTIGVTKAAYTAADDEYKTNGAFTAEGLVDSAVLKAYIADEIAKNAVYWKTL